LCGVTAIDGLAGVREMDDSDWESDDIVTVPAAVVDPALTLIPVFVPRYIFVDVLSSP